MLLSCLWPKIKWKISSPWIIMFLRRANCSTQKLPPTANSYICLNSSLADIHGTNPSKDISSVLICYYKPLLKYQLGRIGAIGASGPKVKANFYSFGHPNSKKVSVHVEQVWPELHSPGTDGQNFLSIRWYIDSYALKLCDILEIC